MKRQLSALAALLGLVCWPTALAGEEGESPFAVYLHDPALRQRLAPVIERLESDSYHEREAASRELHELPALPPFIRTLAAEERRPESRSRLRALVAAFPIEAESARLTLRLRALANSGEAGRLGEIVEILSQNLWSPGPVALHEAARATVTPDDLPLLERLAVEPDPALRRVAAAGYGGLDPARALEALAALALDEDSATAMLAATRLGEWLDNRSLAAFARLLDSPDFATRHRAHQALRGLAEQHDLPFDPAAPLAERTPAAARWREWAASADARIRGAIPEDRSIRLFNGVDLNGWEVVEGEAQGPAPWSVIDGTLHCEPRSAGHLWTEARFENYLLTLEYRIDAPAGDSGVGLLLTEDMERLEPAMGYLEVQLLAGRGGDLYRIGGIDIEAGGEPLVFSRRRDVEVDDPAGEWHELSLEVRDGNVFVDLNGERVSTAENGPRGPGRILLRNEGNVVSFRNLVLHPLERGEPAGG